MLTFLLAVTINSLLFVGFLAASLAHANGSDMPLDYDLQTDPPAYAQTVNEQVQPDPVNSFILNEIHFPVPAEPPASMPQIERLPCYDKGFDLLILDQAALAGQPVVIEDFTDDDSLQINYRAGTNAEGEQVLPRISVDNFADDTGAYIRLNGQTLAEIPGGQFMSPDNINLVAA